jgi:hypothetical protein
VPKRVPSKDVEAFRYDRIFNAAVYELVRVKHRLLTKYISLARKSLAILPEEYLFDLRSFSVLASGVFEQCTEDLAWAHAYEMCDEVNQVVALGRARNLAKASGLLGEYVENVILNTNGIKEHHFNTITSSVGIYVALIGNQKTSFEQLGQLRGQSAHTYAVTQKSPQEVWDYSTDVLQALRTFATTCSNGLGSFTRI